MPRRFRLRTTCIAAAIIALLTACATAPIADAEIPSGLTLGLQQLNEHDYRSALGSFQQAARIAPGNVQVRYCLGIALHYLGFLDEAQREYTWVAKNATDPNLQRRALKGIASVNDVEMPTGAAAGQGMLSRSESISQYGRAAAAKPPGYTQGVPSVVCFWVDWCGWSLRFEDMMLAANRKYGKKVKFILIDAERQTDLRDQYGVSAFPTTFFFDGNGNMLTVFDGCPKREADFDEMLKDFFPQLGPNHKPPSAAPTHRGTVVS